MGLDIRPLTADDDLRAEVDLASRAFGPGDDADRLATAERFVAAGQYLGVFDGPALIATARYTDIRQWWRGRPVRTAAIVSVKVAPEERGRGAGRALMTALVELTAERGFALSVLYPATARLYRSVGYELAGGQYEVVVPSRSLLRLLPPDVAAGYGQVGADPGAVADAAAGRAGLRRAGPADAAEIVKVEESCRMAARDCGPITYGAADLAGLIDDEEIYCYLAPDGSVAYRWNRSQDELTVYSLVAGSAATARALWLIVASHATMVARVRAYVSPADPVNWLLSEPDAALARAEQWMLRLLDPAAAISGRGYPAGARAVVPLELTDTLFPAHSGRWLLEIAAGEARLSRPGSGPGGAGTAGPAGAAATDPLRLGPRGLAALYAGTPLRTLRIAGLITGGEDAAEALDEAFGCTPHMFDYF
ncbi:MAG TPA: GNAT family N-acetyltransferase [Streptosporangiaceae bacterium]